MASDQLNDGRNRQIRIIEGLEMIQEDSNGDYDNDVDAAATEPSNEQQKKRTAGDKLVFASRTAVFLVIVASALIVSFVARYLLKNDEANDFERQFLTFADELHKVAALNVKSTYETLHQFSLLYTSFSTANGEVLPFVTIPDFETFGAEARSLAGAGTIMFLPLLLNSQDVAQWNVYSPLNTGWIERSRAFRHDEEEGHLDKEISNEIPPFVYQFERNSTTETSSTISIPASPIWQINLADHVIFRKLRDYTKQTGFPVLSDELAALLDESESLRSSVLIYPVKDVFEQDGAPKVSGHLLAWIPWTRYFGSILPLGHAMELVLESCGLNTTWHIDGPKATFVGNGDLHRRQFDHLEFKRVLDAASSYEDDTYADIVCNHTIHMFPTEETRSTFRDGSATSYPIVISAIFLFTAALFVAYDVIVSRRQNMTETEANRTGAIVQELFPGKVATQLFDQNSSQPSLLFPSSDTGSSVSRSNAIAELHPAASVLFADISGFTAWASMREPHQVFKLLETIFQSFDKLARRYGVFKVETIGDCYVASCGVTKKNARHAVVMAKFSRDALNKFNELVSGELATLLGPDTVDLGMRFGIHSGPVTAASRIETTGRRNQIHLSETTAKELTHHGKHDWVVPREDKVKAKGKGTMQTYWLVGDGDRSTTLSGNTDSIRGIDANGVQNDHVDTKIRAKEDELLTSGKKSEKRLQKLIDWNTELISQFLRKIVADRDQSGREIADPEDILRCLRELSFGILPVDQVAEIIDMPSYKAAPNMPTVELGASVTEQLRDYITYIASTYSDDNEFHNFEHACHVTMSVSKLLSRIGHADTRSSSDSKQYSYAATIKGDPLTQLACVFGAVIHDAGHKGISNYVLMQEEPERAAAYKHTAVAEQRSIDIAWARLLSPRYDALRRCMFTDTNDVRHFRQLLVNLGLATDIFDKGLSKARSERWKAAFGNSTTGVGSSQKACADRRATIVVEHLIQASDVSHCMQHFVVYKKWNQRLFREMHTAFQTGRSDKDPAVNWYEGELAFFDKYIIPLAKKLEECGVFGVSSDEYIAYAKNNRQEWERAGRSIVAEMVAEVEQSSYEV